MAQAKVLRLLRADACAWWYFSTLRKQGQLDKARSLERESIRREVRHIRENIDRPIQTHSTDVIEFTDSITAQRRPFDLSPMQGGLGTTVIMSGCHPGFFAAFVYCYANRIGLKYTAKASDRV